MSASGDFDCGDLFQGQGSTGVSHPSTTPLPPPTQTSTEGVANPKPVSQALNVQRVEDPVVVSTGDTFSSQWHAVAAAARTLADLADANRVIPTDQSNSAVPAGIGTEHGRGEIDGAQSAQGQLVGNTEGLHTPPYFRQAGLVRATNHNEADSTGVNPRSSCAFLGISRTCSKMSKLVDTCRK